MKNILFTLGIAVMSFIPFAVHAHDPEGRVSIESDMVGPVSAGVTHYVFELVDTKLNTVLKDTDFQITSGKILHMLAYDPALKEFQHVYPQFDGRYWRVDLNFALTAKYWVWVQGQLASDGTEFSGSTQLQVNGGKTEWPIMPLADIRTGSDSGSIVTLSNDTLQVGKMAMLQMTFTRVDGSKAQISPYLGSIAHVTAASEDGDSLVFVYPMDGNTPSDGMLHVTFNDALNYRLWVEFMDNGILKTVELAVTVKP